MEGGLEAFSPRGGGERQEKVVLFEGGNGSGVADVYSGGIGVGFRFGLARTDDLELK